MMDPGSKAQSTETGSSGPIFSWGRIKGNEQEEDDFGCGSPNLWRPGSTYYPMSLPTMYPMSARAEEIAKGRQELIKMFEGMPETSYELSLSDLVEQKKSNQEANAEAESEERNAEKEGKRKTKGSYKSGSMKKVGEDSKQFLLNIFIPSSLTYRSHSTASKSLPTKNDDSQKGSGNKYNFAYILDLLKAKTRYCSFGSPISFSKVSPKPFSAKEGKDYQPLPITSMESCHRSRLSKLTRLSRCSLCYGYTFFSKVDCQECGKSFCKNCIKVCTAEGQKCHNNCQSQFHSNRYSEAQFKCLSFLPLKRVKSERKCKFPLKDEEHDYPSI